MFTLSCESTTDITSKYLTERQIPILRYTYTVDGTEFTDDMGEGDGLKIFYEQLLGGKRPLTSLINADKYKDFFRELLQKGDVLHIAFGSGMSQSVYNAFSAAEQLKKEFPKRKILVVDSTCSCVGYGLFVDAIADLRDQGKNIDQLYDWAKRNCHKVHHQFFSTTLTYFRRSGRVSGPAALIGNMLKLCPIMHLNYDGKIIAYTKVMSVSKAISKTLAEVAANIRDGADYNDRLWVCHSDCADMANNVVEQLKRQYPAADIRLFDIGPVIASHCGPGTVATFFWGNERPQ